MRKVLLALAGTVTGTILLIGLKGTQDHPTALTDAGGRGAGAGDGGGAVPAALPPGTYAVTGPVEGTPFGPVQVQIKIDNAKIVDVIAVRTPSEHGRSIEINRFATPVLRQEALTAQSAQIEVVSGATYTSDGYARSLQAALDEAVTGRHD